MEIIREPRISLIARPEFIEPAHLANDFRPKIFFLRCHESKCTRISPHPKAYPKIGANDFASPLSTGGEGKSVLSATQGALAALATLCFGT